MSYLESLQDHIVANALGVLGTTSFIGYMDDLDQTGPVSALAPQNGTTREVMGGASVAVDMPVIQLSVRAPSYSAAYDHGMAIRSLLIGIKNQTIQGTYFLRVAPSGTLRDIGKDAKGRQMFTVELDVFL